MMHKKAHRVGNLLQFEKLNVDSGRERRYWKPFTDFVGFTGPYHLSKGPVCQQPSSTSCSGAHIA